MKGLFSVNKFIIAVIFFCLGFWTNHLYMKFKPSVQETTISNEERFPVNPDDFDQKSMIDTIARVGDIGMGEVSHHEDEKFFYYEVPLKNQDGTNHKMNVEIKNGMIRISEADKSEGHGTIETSSEHMFSIDPSLDADKADIINEKDKIVIKIPKK